MTNARQQLNRREFLRHGTQVAALALGVTGARTLPAAEASVSAGVQVGILLGTFRSGSLEARLDAVKAGGLGTSRVRPYVKL